MTPGGKTDPGRPCPEPEELALLLDGKADRRQRTRLLRHLKRCPVCYEIFIEASGTLETLQDDDQDD